MKNIARPFIIAVIFTALMLTLSLSPATAQAAADDGVSSGGVSGDVNGHSKYFFLHAGVVTLNPYKIIADAGSSTGFSLEQSGDTDTNTFIEGVLKKRNAWLRDPGNERFDYEFRLGIYNASDQESSGAVVAGSSDASAEISLGYNLFASKNLKLRNALIKRGKALEKDAIHAEAINLKDSATYTVNIEVLYNMVTDKGSQEVHDYIGAGIVHVWGIPWKTAGENDSRTLEFLFGTYYGEIDTPNFVNDTTREVKTKHGSYPTFERTTVATLRGDVHLPIGKHGFFTLGGRFHKDVHSDSKITPWALNAGITIETDKVVSNIAGAIKALIPGGS